MTVVLNFEMMKMWIGRINQTQTDSVCMKHGRDQDAGIAHNPSISSGIIPNMLVIPIGEKKKKIKSMYY